jgi:ArsR family transcriptional regulator, cadmium/lead-responsive transcriptional repressor
MVNYHRYMPIRSAAVAGPAVLLFHSLADPARLEIVRLLADGERRVVDLTRTLGLAQSTISGHVACLHASGVVEPRPDGRSTYYRLARPELWPLLAAADDMLRAGGVTGSLCPEHHRPDRLGER